MPRKRNPKLFLIEKQVSMNPVDILYFEYLIKSECNVVLKVTKKLIASRMMEISLKVDDYIYKDKPITAKNARMFIKEVSGYKDKCYGDKRSLQVIEKLVRCMNGIITEQAELQSSFAETNDVTLVDVETILASPVDKDMTQFTQEFELHKILESSKSFIESKNICDDTDSDIDEHFNGNEIKLCNNGDKHKNSTNKQLERAISNLTVGDMDDPLSITAFNPEDCSQSILNDFGCFDDGKISEKPIAYKIVQSQFEAAIPPVTVTKRYNNDSAVTNANLTVITKNRKRKLPKVSKAQDSSKFNPPEVTAPRIRNNCEMDKNIIEEKAQRKRRQKQPQFFYKNDKQEMEQASGKKNKGKRKEPVELNAIKKRALNNTKTSVKPYQSNVMKGLNATVQNRWNNNFNQRANTEIMPIQTNLFIENPANNTIYANYTENDLSWIENIRFVREIDFEEIIPAYFEDSFWENYTFPNDWNDDDFLYN